MKFDLSNTNRQQENKAFPSQTFLAQLNSVIVENQGYNS